MLRQLVQDRVPVEKDHKPVTYEDDCLLTDEGFMEGDKIRMDGTPIQICLSLYYIYISVRSYDLTLFGRRYIELDVKLLHG